MDISPPEGLPGPPRNPALGWLRFAVWMAPSGAAIAVPFAIEFLRLDLEFALILVGLLFLSFGMGCYDAVIAGPSRRIGDKSPGTAGIVQHGIAFAMLQVAIVPIVGLVLLFGLCVFLG